MPFDPNDPDTKAAIDKIKADSEARIEAMDSKVQEALDEAKKAKAEARKLKDIDPADLQKLEDQVDTLKADLTKAQKEAKDATTAKEKAEKALETESAFTTKLLIQDGVKSALISAGVKDEDFLDSLAAKFSTGASVVQEGAERKAMVGDKALADHIKEWAGSDAGKKFIAAPNNGGGGAPGGGVGATDKNPWAKETMNLTEQSRLYREDPAKAAELAKAAGVTIAG